MSRDDDVLGADSGAVGEHGLSIGNCCLCCEPVSACLFVELADGVPARGEEKARPTGGDIGSPAILDQLATIAPVTAVRGNNDRDAWAANVPETDFLQVGALFIYALHDLALLDIDPAAAGVRVVVSGHSHRPLVEEREGVLFVNPGSAGPRRFSLPISAGELIVEGTQLRARIEQFDIRT